MQIFFFFFWKNVEKMYFHTRDRISTATRLAAKYSLELESDSNIPDLVN